MKYLLVFLFSLSIGIQAQEYAVSLIPQDLLQDAYAVVRKADVKVEFLKYNQEKVTTHIAVTILNEDGLKFAYQNLFYTKSTKINKFEAQLFDANGKLIRKMKKRDIKDVSAYDGYSLFIDTRVKHFAFMPPPYPFTVEYSYEIISSNTINLTSWVSVGNYNLSVEKSTYTLENKTQIPIRKKESGFDYLAVTKSETENSLFYSVENITAIQDEIMSPPLKEITPRVYFSPNEFQLEGVKGKMENWQEFGKWYYDNLLKNKLDLSKNDKKMVMELVSGIEDPVEKVQILYEFLQSKTRYVNISIGIGGWEPFPASYVSEKNYGDCKALSNYMVSLLDVIGIEAFHTIIAADNNRKVDLEEDFPSLQGNHMIVNVPIGDEIIWLECTNQQTAFNYLGSSTDDRYALSISPEGGKIITTKKYPAEENKKQIKAKGKLSPDGNLSVVYSIETSGLYYQNYYLLDFMETKEKEKRIENILRKLPGASLQSYSFENDRKNAIFTTNLKVESKYYAKKIDKNLIFNPVSFEGLGSWLKKDDNRKYPFEIRFGYSEETEFDLDLPPGFQLNETFTPLFYKSEFGNYSLNIQQETPNRLKIKRTLIVNDGSYSKEKFNDYVEFQHKISSMDNVKLLIEAKE
ncbi:MAG: DUF3857 domain-containing protein [Weeksellaceae bacterium]|nr:DUF3857 domain-containing protein [Weeksellaceae bacterium]